jgi:hypothetical protein
MQTMIALSSSLRRLLMLSRKNRTVFSIRSTLSILMTVVEADAVAALAGDDAVDGGGEREAGLVVLGPRLAGLDHGETLSP